MLRIDKILTHMGFGTRSEIKKILKNGSLLVDGEIVRDAAKKVDPDKAQLIFQGQPVKYREFIYLMLNKPQGVVSATEDNRFETVIDLVKANYGHFQLFPVGRLDKDTEGLLILTNDGKFAHEVIAPKKHVAKRYCARVNGYLTTEDVEKFKQGIYLAEEDYHTLPAQLEILSSGVESEAEVVIYEGKYHQVKRMFTSVGKEVTFLKRLAIGALKLDVSLSLGAYRELTSEERELLLSKD